MSYPGAEWRTRLRGSTSSANIYFEGEVRQTMNLDDIRASVEQKYQSYDITVGQRVVVLRNAIRLPSADRKALSDIQEEIKTTDDHLSCMKKMLKVVIEKDADYQALVKAIGDDLAVYAEIVGEYGKRTQVGEALGSQS